MSGSSKIRYLIDNIYFVLKNEVITIGTSYAIIMVLLGGNFIYGFLYNIMYEPNVVRKAPVVVVDNSKTELSRKYIDRINATPNIHVINEAVDFKAAREIMKKNEAKGIMLIPEDFEEKVGRAEEAIYMMYESTSVFLYYLAMQKASSFVMLDINSELRPDQLAFMPTSDAAKMAQSSSPIKVVGQSLFNYSEGYATYLIPAVLMIILFQTIIMVVSMVIGGEVETGKILQFMGLNKSLGGLSLLVFTKSLVYVSLYALFAFFFTGWLPLLFDLPHIGHWFDIIILMIPYLFSTCFFAMSLSFLFTDQDGQLLMIAFFSVMLVFLSGVSYPLELMPWYWQGAHFVFPAAAGTLAYVKINSMGADLSQIWPEYITLWVQCFIYFFVACVAYRYNINKAIKKRALQVS